MLFGIFSPCFSNLFLEQKELVCSRKHVLKNLFFFLFFLLKIKQVYQTEPEKQYQIAPEFFMQRVNTLD